MGRANSPRVIGSTLVGAAIQLQEGAEHREGPLRGSRAIALDPGDGCRVDPGELGADAGGIEFLPFSDVELSVREDVAFLRASPLIPDDVPIRGFVYDVRTGRLREVDT